MACLPLAWLGFGCAAALAAVPAQSELKVVVTVKPVHSLVAAVMAGVGEPRLLIDGFASPHTFSLKPSDAHALNKADLIFRVSDGLEPFMIRILKSLPGSVRVVTLEEAPGLTLHAQRTGGTFEDHAHGAGRRRHDHPHTSRADAGRDGHVWLDPANAKVIARYAAEVLSAEAPGDAAKFNANYRVLAERLDALSSELERRLRPLAGRPYVVFHDAYQYLERRYHLSPAGSVTISPDLMPSAKRLGALRRKIIELNATCVFVEPQFEPRLVDTVVEGTGARTGRLDPLGASVPAGPDLYLTLMRGLAADLEACLEGAT
jgi:zinc transport system substrate-binding protein